MSGDFSLQRFDPHRDFSGVLMQQGRVQLDSDWNEQVEILNRRRRAQTVDLIGRTGVPRATPDGFKISVDANGQLTIGGGRIYVDGLLAENHGLRYIEGVPDQKQVSEFDAVLSELRGRVDAIELAAQPYVPKPASAPTNGIHLIYLDVWQREVTFLEAPDIVEKAVGVDTTARMQTVWQVKILPDLLSDSATCGTPDENLSGWPDVIRPSAGRLTTAVVDAPKNQGPCLLPPTAGYRGLENRLYRVEIHEGGPQEKATFKWSRDNASVVATVTAIPSLDTIVVDQLGRDSVLRFNDNDWIEVSDDAHVLSAQPAGMLPGELRRITVDASSRTIKLNTSLTATDFETQPDRIRARHTHIRRWDQTGADVVANQGVLPVPAEGQFVTLEDGIQVSFSIDPANKDGEFHVGDYWVFAARTADASVEELKSAPPRGNHHHYCRLALAEFDGTKWNVLTDCRKVFPPLTELTTLFYVGGDGQEVAPNPSLPDVLLPLPKMLEVGVSNGQWPVVGAQVRFQVKTGSGKVEGANDVIVTTGADGVAGCSWSLDATTPDQHVEATLLDANSQPMHLPVRFHAHLSVASRVAYEPKACPTLAGVTNVQEAIDILCKATHGSGCCITVGSGGEFARLDEALQALQEKKVADVCICLLPGDHEMMGVVVSAPIVHLSITGCGPGTRLKVFERPWRIAGLKSFTLRDVAVNADGVGEPLQFDECREVTIRNCQMSQTMQGGALVTIRSAEQVGLTDNTITSMIPRRIPLPPVFFDRLPEGVRLFELQDRNEFRQAAAITAETLTQLNVRERTRLASELRRSVESLRNEVSDSELVGFQGIVDVLDSNQPQPRLLAQRFELLQASILRGFPGLALVLTSENALLENNSITGDVSLYGPPGPTDLKGDELKQLGSILSDVPGVVSVVQGTLHVRGNRLTRLTIAESSVKRLLEFLGNPGGRIVFDSIFKLSFLSDNKIEGNGNKFLGEQFSFNANSFSHLGKDGNQLAGWAVSNSALFMANQSPSPFEVPTSLNNVSRSSFPKTKSVANFVLQIADFGG